MNELTELFLQVEPLWEGYRTDFKILNRYAVDFLYLGESAGKEEAA